MKSRGVCNRTAMFMIIVTMIMMTKPTAAILGAEEADLNDVFDPCSDSKVQKLDGFTFGIAFSKKENFFFNETQLSPCDARLSLSDGRAQLAMFRPKVDEISLLSVDNNTIDLADSGVYMVAFAGRKYAARSQPKLVADGAYTITSFTLILEFQSGTLQDFHWKNSGCQNCHGDASECYNGQECAVSSSKCKTKGGDLECSFSIQLGFAGTDKNLDALNSWYELKNLRRNSLFGLFSSVRDSLLGRSDNV